MHETLQRFKMAKLVPFEVSFTVFPLTAYYKALYISEPRYARTFATAILADAALESAAAHRQQQVRNLEGAKTAQHQVANAQRRRARASATHLKNHYYRLGLTIRVCGTHWNKTLFATW